MAEEAEIGKISDAKLPVSSRHPLEIAALVTDYTLSNPDTLTKYKTAAQISHKVLDAVTGWCVEGAKVVSICERGDKLLEEEIAKVYKGKKIVKGVAHPTTVSPSSYVTPYTPLTSDTEEAEVTLKPAEIIKIQLGAQIDGFGTIVCDSIRIPSEKDKDSETPAREADLMLATHYANELLIRLMLPPGLLASGTDEEKKQAAAEKPITQSKMNSLLEKVVKSFDCNLIESTTSWLFERNEIEGKKKIILAPGTGVKGEGSPEVGEVWGVEMGVTTGNGKVKKLDDKRSTLHRRTTTTYQLKRPSSRQTLSEIVKKFSTFPFSLRQLDDERAAKVGIVECVRSGVVREYEVVAESDAEPVARIFTTIAITKNGITRLAAPPTLDVTKYKTENKITDEEILKILEQPVSRSTGSKNKNKKKKKPAKKAANEGGESSEEK
ncbi:MAG: Curved DNA-binding protein (42 kDa protein) [Cirrosporium novae-zelandiae]|nr:MAG: Curved DNA-binding protein (42 kDa protein) [Cirrosporium novae-zelandiae]